MNTEVAFVQDAESAERLRNFRRVLIANRGEIAVRVIHACRAAGLETVQVHSIADSDSLAVRLADRSVCIGGPRPSDSYLSVDALLEAARTSGADAVHPGYGFLSENAEFAERVGQAGLVYVGPQAQIIRTMGDKAAARQCAMQAGVPVVPGSSEPVHDETEALVIAAEVGYPVVVKAVAGGGGRGMRVAKDEAELRTALERAASEAKVAFGNGAVYVEKFLKEVRHIEVQVMGDGHRAIHLGERDCTIQRRHQKLVEEGPSPALSTELRAQILDAATRLTQSVGYRSAGTVEFIFDARGQRFYFIEMNTRIQVEHPVTEVLTGLDLVKMQLAIARGEPLPIDQAAVTFNGHAIECRINAEDPDKGFMPRAGRLTEFMPPSGPGIRVDSHAYPGYDLPPYYDSLIAKVIAWGPDRGAAIARMRRALSDFKIEGVATTIDFHKRLLEEPRFIDGDVHTRFIKEQMWAGHPMRHLL